MNAAARMLSYHFWESVEMDLTQIGEIDNKKIMNNVPPLDSAS